MRSMELVGRERMEVAVSWTSESEWAQISHATQQQLSIWGEACDDDVSDVTDKLGVLIYEVGELEDQFVDRYDQYRVTIKSIRNIEASVQPSRDRKQKITDQIAQLKYKEPNSPRIVVLEQELVRAEAESLVAEAQLSNITREKLKAAFTYQFDALREHCEKLAIIAGYGKHLLELIDDTPVTPGETRNAYDGYEASKAYVPSFLRRPRSKKGTNVQSTASSKTAKTPSQTGSPPTPPSSPSSPRAPATSPSAAPAATVIRARVWT